MYVTVAYVKSVFCFYITLSSLSVTWMVVVYNLGIKYPLNRSVEIEIFTVGVNFTPFRFRFIEGGTFRFNRVLSAVKDFSDFFFGQQAASGPVLL